MIYGYARVSTAGQARDGNSLDVQESALRAAGAQVIYSEHFTGTKKSRPELDKLMAVLSPGDTVVVTKLDRIARSTTHGVELISDLIERGVRVNILNLGVMDNTPASKLIRSVFFAFAEFERDMIVERTSEGKVTARMRQGAAYKEGRKQIELPVHYGQVMGEYRMGGMTANEAARALGVSPATFFRWLSREQIYTAN